jgi:hypothetical protein
LHQHRPRCRYKGDADSFAVSVPNYNKMIDEDDPIFLRAMRALDRLPVLELHVSKLKTRLLIAGVAEKEIDELLHGKKKAGDQ